MYGNQRSTGGSGGHNRTVYRRPTQYRRRPRTPEVQLGDVTHTDGLLPRRPTPDRLNRQAIFDQSEVVTQESRLAPGVTLPPVQTREPAL